MVASSEVSFREISGLLPRNGLLGDHAREVRVPEGSGARNPPGCRNRAGTMGRTEFPAGSDHLRRLSLSRAHWEGGGLYARSVEFSDFPARYDAQAPSPDPGEGLGYGRLRSLFTSASATE